MGYLSRDVGSDGEFVVDGNLKEVEYVDRLPEISRGNGPPISAPHPSRKCGIRSTAGPPMRMRRWRMASAKLRAVGSLSFQAQHPCGLISDPSFWLQPLAFCAA